MAGDRDCYRRQSLHSGLGRCRLEGVIPQQRHSCRSISCRLHSAYEGTKATRRSSRSIYRPGLGAPQAPVFGPAVRIANRNSDVTGSTSEPRTRKENHTTNTPITTRATGLPESLPIQTVRASGNAESFSTPSVVHDPGLSAKGRRGRAS
jgi:hypothetical protein